MQLNFIEYYDPTKGDWNSAPLDIRYLTISIEYYDPTKGDWNTVKTTAKPIAAADWILWPD